MASDFHGGLMITSKISGDAVCDPLTTVAPFGMMSVDKMKTKHNSVKNYYYLWKTWNTNHVIVDHPSVF